MLLGRVTIRIFDHFSYEAASLCITGKSAQVSALGNNLLTNVNSPKLEDIKINQA